MPTRVRIPAIGVNSSLIRLGLQDDASLQVPPNGFPAGWYTGAPTPGELGPAIIAGHVHWDGAPGVFSHLGNLLPGDMLTVTRKDGSRAVFRVTRVMAFDKTRFPTAAVYGNINRAGLRVITCSGLDPETGKYEANIVVFAALVKRR